MGYLSKWLICLNVEPNSYSYSLDEVRVFDGMGREVNVDVLGEQCLEIQSKKPGMYWVEWQNGMKPFLLVNP